MCCYLNVQFQGQRVNQRFITNPAKRQQYIYLTDQLHNCTSHGHRQAGHRKKEKSVPVPNCVFMDIRINLLYYYIKIYAAEVDSLGNKNCKITHYNFLFF